MAKIDRNLYLLWKLLREAENSYPDSQITCFSNGFEVYWP